MAIIDDARMALKITSTGFDTEIERLIAAARADLTIAGVILPDPLDDLTETAVLTYVCMHFGNPPNYDKLADAYEIQKVQLMHAAGYTDYGEEDQEEAATGDGEAE